MGLTDKHHRRSIRLQGYDYSQAGFYFLTIVCQDRTDCFGCIANGIMKLNDAGKMVEKWYWELGNKFPDIQCNEMVIMPNHIHFIIKNVVVVGADLCVCPVCHDDLPPISGEPNNNTGEHKGEHIGSPLHRVVQWFKTMTTNEYIRGVKSYNWHRFNKRLWQRNYWEHIVRNENEYDRIAQYIINNPIKWNNDKLNNGSENSVMESPVEYGVGADLRVCPDDICVCPDDICVCPDDICIRPDNMRIYPQRRKNENL